MPVMVHDPSALLLPNRVPATDTPGPPYENGIASALATPLNTRAQPSTARTSTCVFIPALSAAMSEFLIMRVIARPSRNQRPPDTLQEPQPIHYRDTENTELISIFFSMSSVTEW